VLMSTPLPDEIRFIKGRPPRMPAQSGPPARRAGLRQQIKQRLAEAATRGINAALQVVVFPTENTCEMCERAGASCGCRRWSES
jgi:hypothetical protein